jgi:hypothetical protein
MNYAHARDLIGDGDLIAVRKRGGLPARAIRWVTRSPYTHTAIAVWGGFGGARRLLVAEANAGGCSLAPLSHYAEDDFDVFACPVSRAAAMHSAWSNIGSPLTYDFLDLARIAANRLLGVPLPPPDPEATICSALSASIYLQAGWKPAALPSIPAPVDVVRAIGSLAALEVRVG